MKAQLSSVKAITCQFKSSLISIASLLRTRSSECLRSQPGRNAVAFRAVYPGDPNSTTNTKTGWTNTFGGLVAKYPNIKFFAAEYGPMQREINDVVFGLPKNQGIGIFNWEPTTQGDWNTGHDLLRRSGTTYTAQPTWRFTTP